MALRERSINRIDVFYTDNPKSDKSVIKITDRIILVKKGKIFT
jgi:hypothetical protein